MSACSSTLGSSCRSRKHSSVRNRPTPSTGWATAFRADSPSATLASSLTGAPSLVRPGPAQEARAARCSRSAATRRSASSASGSVSMVPAVPSTSRRVPLAISSAPAVPDHAGDAELAGDDRGVAGRSALLGDQGVHDVGVEPRGVGGSEVLGDEHAGCGGQRHARLGLADEVGDHAAFDVAQVGGALGHQPAHAGEDGDELLHRRVHGRDDRRAGGQVLLRRRTGGPCPGPGPHLRSAPPRRHRSPSRPCRRTGRRRSRRRRRRLPARCRRR